MKDKCLNIFDLCFGFGKKLCHEFPYLFGKSEDKLKVEGVGFSLINACLGYKVSDLDKLHLNIKKIGDSEKINLFLEKIIETTREIDKTLRIVTTFKGNKRDSKNITINHTEMQIVSIIAFVFGQKYVTLEKDELTETIKNRILSLNEYSTLWKENKKSFESQQKIYKGLRRLLKTKPLSEITVSDIKAECNISRSTFYRNFKKWFRNILSTI